jgi:hypothetical protein
MHGEAVEVQSGGGLMDGWNGERCRVCGLKTVGTDLCNKHYKEVESMFNIKKLRIPLPKKPEQIHKDKSKCDRSISKKTLRMLDSSIRNFKKGIVSEPIDLSDVNDMLAEQKTYNNEESPDDSEISA